MHITKNLVEVCPANWEEGKDAMKEKQRWCCGLSCKTLMVNELNTDTLHEEIQSNEKVIVQYSAGWCGNCRIMKPKFKKMSSENENMHFLMIDAEKILILEN